MKTSSGITINGVIGGSGPPVLLLHGAPANLASWRKMTPEMAKKYTIVATDLRGYGESDMPDGARRHENYSKRAMAQDQGPMAPAQPEDSPHSRTGWRSGQFSANLAPAKAAMPLHPRRRAVTR